jgi:hypothetical protein
MIQENDGKLEIVLNLDLLYPAESVLENLNLISPSQAWRILLSVSILRLQPNLSFFLASGIFTSAALVTHAMIVVIRQRQ